MYNNTNIPSVSDTLHTIVYIQGEEMTIKPPVLTLLIVHKWDTQVN